MENIVLPSTLVCLSGQPCFIENTKMYYNYWNVVDSTKTHKYLHAAFL